MFPTVEKLVGALALLTCAAAHGFYQEPGRIELYQSGSKAFVERRFDAAIADLRKSLELDPKQLRAIRLLGLTYQLAGQMENAEAQFTRASELAPKDPEAWFYLGRVQYLRNFFEQAISSLHVAEKYAPDDWRIRECLGLALEAAGDTDSAEREYRQAVAAKQSKSGSPYLNYGALLLKLGRTADSEKMLTRAAELMPVSWQSHFELAKLYQQSDRFEAALKELTTALASSPTSEEAARTQALMAIVYSRLGRDMEARTAAAAAEK